MKNNPQRFHFPKYEDFFNILFRIFKSFDGRDLDNYALSDLHVLIRSIFYNHKDPMPKAFDRVWEIFCNPRDFKCHTGIRCEKCNEIYDILIEYDDKPRTYEYDRLVIQEEIYINHCRVACPSCGYDILHLTGAKLVGVFSHVHEEYKKANIGGRGNEFSRQFESYF
jgi:hypothetical protein